MYRTRTLCICVGDRAVLPTIKNPFHTSKKEKQSQIKKKKPC